MLPEAESFSVVVLFKPSITEFLRIDRSFDYTACLTMATSITMSFTLFFMVAESAVYSLERSSKRCSIWSISSLTFSKASFDSFASNYMLFWSRKNLI